MIPGKGIWTIKISKICFRRNLIFKKVKKKFSNFILFSTNSTFYCSAFSNNSTKSVFMQSYILKPFERQFVERRHFKNIRERKLKAKEFSLA